MCVSDTAFVQAKVSSARMERNRLQRFWFDRSTDTGWSWAVLAFTWIFLALTIGFATTGCVGVLFVQFSAVFNASRKEAAWPFSVIGIMQCITGLLAGTIIHCFDMRLVMLFGVLICSLATALCFVANGLLFISIVFGAFFGTGNAIIYTGGLVFIQQYFKTYQATANGIVTTALPMSGTFLPYLLDYLIEEYGLRGSMLIYGGILLHLVILAPLMKPRIPPKSPRRVATPYRNHELEKVNGQSITAEDAENEAVGITRTSESPGVTVLESQNQQLLEKVNPEVKKVPIHNKAQRFSASLQNYKKVLSQPIFYVITFPVVVGMSILVGLSLTLLDFAFDCELTKDDGLLLVATFSFSGVVGRVGSGWVADRGWLSREKISMLGMFLMATSLLLLGFVWHMPLIMTLVIVTGIGEGSVTSITNVLYYKHLGFECLSTALGLKMFASGFLAFFRPLLIGYLRDALGTHGYFYCVMGCLSLVSGLMWVPTIFCRRRG